MPAHLDFELRFGRPPIARRLPDDSPMRVLLLGNFTGGVGGAVDASATLHPRALHRVDVDNLDQVVRRIAPRVTLAAEAGSPMTTLDIGSLDDFHPDRLVERVDLFGRLLDLRDRLRDAARFEQAADELRQDGLAEASVGEGAAGGAASVGGEDDSATLQRLLGGATAPRRTTPSPGAAGIDALIRGIVAPDIVSDRSHLQAQYVAAVDAAMGEQMRRLLHAPAFRALEVTWRSVQWLVSRLELDDALQLHLLDVSRDRLQADLAAAQGDPSRSGLARLLCGPGNDAPGDPGWSLIVGLFNVGPSAEDLDLLAGLGAVAAQAGGPFVAGAAPALFGCPSIPDLIDPHRWQPLPDDRARGWSDLRHCALAPWIGLVAPRLLLRLPYGKATDPIERFAFEEQGAFPVHETLTWGSGALAVALLIGQAFTGSGWNLALGQAQDLTDLPAYTFHHDGEPQLQPCAEAWLGEHAGQALLELGLMPLLSHRARPAVRLMRMQSIADPACGLAGGWG